jgi:hypothetical protein
VTDDEVKQRLIRIGSAAMRGDIRSAQLDEQRLHLDVLRAIATRSVSSPSKLAALAASTAELVFDRGE